MLVKPNPHGRPNSDVVRPWVNGLDITRRPRHMWIIDFPPGMSEKDAALYEAPFEYVKSEVKPERAANARQVYAQRWWIHGEARPDMRGALAGLMRYVGTPRLTKFRLFVWLPPETLADSQLIVFARSDDYFFGVLQSRAHEVWALSQGTQLRADRVTHQRRASRRSRCRTGRRISTGRSRSRRKTSTTSATTG
jgi:hypothetical protein